MANEDYYQILGLSKNSDGSRDKKSLSKVGFAISSRQK